MCGGRRKGVREEQEKGCAEKFCVGKFVKE